MYKNQGIITNKSKFQWSFFFMALPFMAFVVMFNYVPLFGWILSLFDFKPGTPIFKNEFVGLKYFELIITDGKIIRVLKNTLIFSGFSFLLLPLPMIFAILLNEIGLNKCKKTVQTITTLPHFISWIIVYSVIFSVFSKDGLLNEILIKMKVIENPTNVLGDPNAVYWFHILLLRWKEIGWMAIIYIASIVGIDQELYEAAYIDGANRFNLARYVTIPGLMPTFVVLMILNVAGFVNIGIEQYFVFKNALVYDNIEVLDLYTYRIGLQLLDYSYATTISILKSCISLALLFGSNFIAKKIRGTSII